MIDLTELPPETHCVQQDCGHPLSEHEEMSRRTPNGPPEKIFPCVHLYPETSGACSCRDFIPPQPPVDLTGLKEELDRVLDQPPIVTHSFIAGVKLNFHEGGTVSWERIPGVSVP